MKKKKRVPKKSSAGSRINVSKRKKDSSPKPTAGLERRRSKPVSELVKVNEKLAEEIAERKEIESVLRQAEEEKSLLLNSSSDLIVYHALDMKVLWVNQTAAVSVEETSETLMGRYCYAIWHGRSEPCVGCPVILARDTGRMHEAEIASPDGRSWFIRGHPIRNYDGRIVALAEYCLDVTKYRQAEHALKKANDELERRIAEKTAQLAESNNRLEREEMLSGERFHFLQTLMDTIPNPVFYKDIEGKYLGCNKAYEEIVGYCMEELVGKTAYQLYPKELADRYFENDNELLKNPGNRTYAWKIVNKKSGETRDAVFNIATFTGIDGTTAGLIGIVSDGTKRKE